ncbi:MAG TPA: hypothetical protein VF796_23395 [Humisphaera sp.]
MTTFIDKTDGVGDTATTSDPSVDRRTDVGGGVTAGGLAPAVAVAVPTTPPDLRADLRNWKDEVLSAIRYERAGGSSTAAYGYSTSSSASGSNLQTKEAVAEVGHAVKADAYQIKDQAETYVMNQPLKAIGIAAGVGFVLGVLWNSRH